MDGAALSSCAIVLVTPQIEKTARFYHEVLGFRVVEHYDHDEPFAALYRDAVEIVLVQAQYGQVRSNRERYGAGYDAYLVPATDDDVEALYREAVARGATVIQPPRLTPYGSLEFSIQDVDGRQIGIGRIQQDAVFFRES